MTATRERLRRLDDRVLRRRRREGEPDGATGGDGLPSFLAVAWRVSRLVLLGLAAVCLLAVAFVLLPTNEDNAVVSTVLDLADQVAGPFRGVFDVDDADRARVYDLGLAAAVYLVAASVVGRLPTGRGRP